MLVRQPCRIESIGRSVLLQKQRTTRDNVCPQVWSDRFRHFRRNIWRCEIVLVDASRPFEGRPLTNEIAKSRFLQSQIVVRRAAPCRAQTPQWQAAVCLDWSRRNRLDRTWNLKCPLIDHRTEGLSKTFRSQSLSNRQELVQNRLKSFFSFGCCFENRSNRWQLSDLQARGPIDLKLLT